MNTYKIIFQAVQKKNRTHLNIRFIIQISFHNKILNNSEFHNAFFFLSFNIQTANMHAFYSILQPHVRPFLIGLPEDIFEHKNVRPHTARCHSNASAILHSYNVRLHPQICHQSIMHADYLA